MTDDEQNDIPELERAAQTRDGFHALAVDQELINDIMKMLRKAPWEEADSVITRVQKCRQVFIPTAP